MASLLCTTLASGAPAAPPFVPPDFPNPQRPVPRQDHVLGTSASLINTTLPVPFSQTDWPLPGRPLPRQHFQAASSNSLINTTLPVPFAQLDWPGAKGSPPRQDYQDSTPNTLINTTLPVPFWQGDWPVTKGLPPRQDFSAGTSNSLLNTTLPVPFNQEDWPVTRGLGPRQDWYEATSNPLVNTTLPVPFFPPVDPVPIGWTATAPRVARVIHERFTQPPIWTLVLPLVPNEYPDPIRLSWRPSTDQLGVTALLFPAVAVGTPFVPVDFPNPRGKAPTAGWVQATPATLINTTLPVPLFGRADPVPRGAAPRQDYVPGSPEALLRPPALTPFSPIDWTNPVNLRSSWRPPSWVVGPFPATIVFYPFIQLAWIRGHSADLARMEGSSAELQGIHGQVADPKNILPRSSS